MLAISAGFSEMFPHHQQSLSTSKVEAAPQEFLLLCADPGVQVGGAFGGDLDVLDEKAKCRRGGTGTLRGDDCAYGAASYGLQQPCAGPDGGRADDGRL